MKNKKIIEWSFFPKNKRAQIFTLLALSLIVLVFLSIQIYSHLRDKETIKQRVKSMDAFLQAVEKNLQRQVYIAGYRIIFLAESEKISKGVFVSDIDDFFEEAYFNGSVEGVDNSLMADATHDYFANTLNEKAAKINVNITLENTVISVSQDNPWNIKFVVKSDFVMQDKQKLAEWRKQQNITAYIPLTQFDDPLYIYATGGLGEERKINKTIYDGVFNVSGDLTNLNLHFVNGNFANNSDAPSFLNRLEGNFSKDPNGIESFVDTAGLPNDFDYSLYNPSGTKSVVDYIYFNLGDSTIGDAVVGMPTRFKIDDTHKARYQID